MMHEPGVHRVKALAHYKGKTGDVLGSGDGIFNHYVVPEHALDVLRVELPPVANYDLEEVLTLPLRIQPGFHDAKISDSVIMQLVVTQLARVLLAPFVCYWTYQAARPLIRRFARCPRPPAATSRDVARAYGVVCAAFLVLEAAAYASFVVRAFNHNFPADMWESTAERMQVLAVNPDWSSATPEEGPEAATFERRRIFEEKWGMCHTLDILFVPGMDGEQVTEEDWQTILARMGRKVPDWLDEDTSLELWPLARAALAAPENFYSDYPHSRRRERPAVKDAEIAR